MFLVIQEKERQLAQVASSIRGTDLIRCWSCSEFWLLKFPPLEDNGAEVSKRSILLFLFLFLDHFPLYSFALRANARNFSVVVSSQRHLLPYFSVLLPYRRGTIAYMSNCPFQKRAGEWGEFRPAKASGIGTRDRVSCLQKKRSEFELFTQTFFYILLKCQSITAVCLDSPTAIEISLLDLSFIACQRT